ncbi:lipocalin-like domain-containing protein [Bacillus cereus]|uniref:lipocalin-like domain-containing protein n=1 Tax=Bacillus TaxID=1386 RepID=UPI0024BB7790|nr:lipocalin-like domain-containing protein [Bacillus cereus]WHS75964.1 lipocalin-like domain-containing protein [Bacillus cereus]
MKQRERFIGTWILVEFYIKKVNNTRIYPFGKKPNGILIYNNDGYMSAVITGENQPSEVILDFKNSSAEAQALAVNHISYCGSFEVKEEIIIHQVQASLFPQWKGSYLKRYYEFKEKNKLILKTDPLTLPKNNEVVVLVWQRCK